MRRSTADLHALVQAGGKGTRLRAATTAEVPKPMAPVGGVPMVERLLRQLVVAGVERITVVTGYLGEVVRSHVEDLKDLHEAAEIDYFAEPAPLGNVGALGRVALDRPLGLLVFGDLVTTLDFAELADRRAASGAAVLLASHWEDHRLQLGELVVEGERVTGYREKPLKRFLICSGIGVFPAEVLALIPGDGRPFGISDLVTAALEAGHGVAHWEHGAFWMDVNAPETLREAERRLREITDAHRSPIVPA